MPFQLSDFVSAPSRPDLARQLRAAPPFPSHLQHCLISGPERSGKTTLLFHFALAAARAGRAVLLLCNRCGGWEGEGGGAVQLAAQAQRGATCLKHSSPAPLPAACPTPLFAHSPGARLQAQAGAGAAAAARGSAAHRPRLAEGADQIRGGWWVRPACVEMASCGWPVGMSPLAGEAEGWCHCREGQKCTVGMGRALAVCIRGARQPSWQQPACHGCLLPPPHSRRPQASSCCAMPPRCTCWTCCLM